MIRRTSYFSGNVQGVGFRFTARHVAQGFKLTGFVRNLPDGRVELVSEGDAKEIERFLAALQRQMEGHIRNRTDSDTPAIGEFRDFDVRR